MSTTRPAQRIVAVEQARSAELDAWIIRVGATGDRASFMALFDHFAPRVKAYLLHWGLSESDADEIAQETLLAVWRRARQFDPATTDAGTWIFTLARNLRSEQLRRQRASALSTAHLQPGSVTSAAPRVLP